MRWLALFLSAAFIAAFAAVAPGSVTVPQSGWSWGNPSPQGNTLRSIDFVGARGFAAGAAGTVLKTDDGGTTWTGLSTGTSADIDRMQVVDADTVVFLGGNGCVLRRTDDGGITFHKIFIAAEVNCPAPVQAFTFVGKQVGYLFLRDGSVMRTDDGGQTFSAKTAVPGTAASTGGGSAKPVEIAFTDEHTGLAFTAPNVVYSTTDDGVSWKPVPAVDPGSVSRAWFMDSKNGFAVGPDTLLQTTDAGSTWKALAAGAGHSLTSIRCVDLKTCLMTTQSGAVLLRTTDGGATATEITPASQAVYAAAYSAAARVVAVGANGTTVLSDDGGVNYAPISHDIGGTYFGLRTGVTPSTVYAVGAKGGLAVSTDAGVTWKTLAVPTSADITDVSFTSATVGYALDRKGGLFKTSNGGTSWQTLDTGTTSVPLALATYGADTVILVGPRGILRATGSGQFQPVGGKTVSKAVLSGVDSHAGVIAAYGAGSANLFVSKNGGQTWTKTKMPGKKIKIARPLLRLGDSVAFPSAKVGYMLDTAGRVWKTTNAGKKWVDQLAAGTENGVSLAFSDTKTGFMSVLSASEAFVLRTTDGGDHWRPQLIGPGLVQDVVAGSAMQAYAIVAPQSEGGGGSLYFTATGGDNGTASRLSLSTKTKTIKKSALKKQKGNVVVSGSLAGAVGGEQIVVSRRDKSTGRWVQHIVTAGANGGSFTTSWKIKGTSVFVAQWAGDSGRAGTGSSVLTITVKK
jgi:photosystem II stability/assembly factor-like uncharacterized protein